MHHIIDNDPMQVRPRMVKPTKEVNAGLVENIIRIFPLPMKVTNDAGIIKLISKIYFPDYYHNPLNHDPDDYIYPLPSFGLYPKNWNTSIYKAFGDKDEICVYLKIGNWPINKCTLSPSDIRTC
jgi:hypothetical protein